jgi:hypothetical protein
MRRMKYNPPQPSIDPAGADLDINISAAGVEPERQLTSAASLNQLDTRHELGFELIIGWLETYVRKPGQHCICGIGWWSEMSNSDRYTSV